MTSTETEIVKLYRKSSFGHLTGKNWVRVQIGTVAECEARAEQLRAKGFVTEIRRKPLETKGKQMTNPNESRVEMLLEVLVEIRRLNDARGETVFNPAATDCVRALLLEFGAKPELIARAGRA